MRGSVLVCVVVALLATGCSLSRGALGTTSDAGMRDVGMVDAPSPDDVGTDAPNIDADIDAGVDAGTDAFVPPEDVGTDVFTPDTGPILPAIGGLTLVLDERGLQSSAGGILAWVDQSGAGNDFTQAVLSRQPAQGTVSGWPAAQFTGSSDLFGPAWNAVFGANGGHLWIVIDNTGATPGADGTPADEDAVISGPSSGGINVSWSATGARGYGYNGAQCPTARVIATPGLHLIDVGYDGAQFSVAVDAQPAAAAACAAPLTLFGSVGFLGGNWDSAHRFVGRIATVIGMNRVPTAPETQTMRDYLGLKYGVAH